MWRPPDESDSCNSYGPDPLAECKGGFTEAGRQKTSVRSGCVVGTGRDRRDKDRWLGNYLRIN